LCRVSLACLLVFTSSRHIEDYKTCTELIDILTSHGAVVQNYVDQRGDNHNPLLILQKKGNIQLLEYLLSVGGASPVVYPTTVTTNQLKCALLMIMHGSTPNRDIYAQFGGRGSN
jgi:hypothetical protein